MKTCIRLILVILPALVTVLFMASCADYDGPRSSGGMVNSAAGVRPAAAASDYSTLRRSQSAPGAEASNSLGGATAPAPEPVRNRPGLATTTGYETTSSVQTGMFYRKAGGVPDATDAFHYNDEVGAKAMMSDARERSGLFPAAGDRLKVGLMSGGDALPRLEANGQRVVIGHAGSYFNIALKNTTRHRVEIVVSVDGLDVLDGKAASVRKYGYVLEAGQEYQIQGLRKNRDTVKQFVFGSVGESTAAKQGMARNVGVVGLAVYEEDEAAAKAAQLAEALKRSGASAFPRN